MMLVGDIWAMVGIDRTLREESGCTKLARAVMWCI